MSEREHLEHEPTDINVDAATEFVITNSAMYSDGHSLTQESLELPNGATIRVEYDDSKKNDIDTSRPSPSKDEVRPFAERLLNEGESFTVRSGSSDDTLEVKFSIEKKAGE
ncbi:hypothetical protein ACFL04_00165 [Patescibacteria group bacterium]